MDVNLSLVRGEPLAEEPFMGAQTIPAYARAVTERFGDAEALVMRGLDGERVSWSYADLWDRSVEVAKALIAAGAGKDARIGILMTNRPEYLACVFGIAMAGGVTVSLSTFSTAGELDHMLKAGAVSILLYERNVLKKDFGAMLAGLEPAIATAEPGALASGAFPYLTRLIALDGATRSSETVAPDGRAVEDWHTFIAAGATVHQTIVAARSASVKPSDTGALFFSSGTTSTPKGIVHAQRAFCIQWWRWQRVMAIDPVNHPVRCWTGNGFFWSGNISQVIGYALTTGGAAILQPVFEAEEALDLIEKERVSFAIGRPHQWARLEASPRWPHADLSSLWYITYASKLHEHPTVSTDWRIGMAFGTTETLTINTAITANMAVKPGSAGKPLPGNILKIVDPLTGAILPVGQRGEMAIKGPTLMIGYVGKTAEETFDEDGFFWTGDGGYVDADGDFFWEGRLTDMIKTGGANVSPLEVDAVLANCPGVKRAQTVGVPHETLDEIVVACIVPHDGAALEEAGVTTFLKAQLASFKVPRAVLFFREDEFVVTGSEKVKTADLKALAAKRLKESGRTEALV